MRPALLLDPVRPEPTCATVSGEHLRFQDLPPFEGVAIAVTPVKTSFATAVLQKTSRERDATEARVDSTWAGACGQQRLRDGAEDRIGGIDQISDPQPAALAHQLMAVMPVHAR